MEHAGYYVTWLCAFFGPVKRVVGFAKVLFPDKETDVPIPVMAPDFTVGCLEFENGVVARITNSVVAPFDHTLQIVGDGGTISIRECWDYGAKIWRETDSRVRRALRRRLGVSLKAGIPLLRKPKFKRYSPAHRMDFMRGIEELGNAIEETRSCRIGTDFTLHVCEIVIAIQNASPDNPLTEIKSRFAPMEPMPWAL
jgi:predicted dehydrogenase